MIKTENFDKLEIENSTELRDWLLKNHTQNEGMWLVTFKKSEKEKYVSRDQVLDELICFGWIDGIRRKSLKKIDGAFNFFDNINDSSKRFVLRWIKLAKTEKTRTNRINKIAKLSSLSEKLPGS